MKIMDTGLIVPKRVLINRPKILQMPPDLFAQAHKFGILIKKMVSVVRDAIHGIFLFL